MNSRAVTTQDIVKVKGAETSFTTDILAIEEPLEIQLAYRESGVDKIKKVSVTMRTPGNDSELGVGFLFTEGIISSRSDIIQVEEDGSDNIVSIHLAEGKIPQLLNTDRNFYTTSSCGVCGKSSIEAIKTVSIFERTMDEIRLRPDIICSLPDKLREQQEVFESTGGLHASALFDLKGNFIMLREDVGRHNALDKVIGAALWNGQLPLSKTVLLLSGRASFELVQKAYMAGIKVIAAVGAPSSLAVAMAKENGITLIGFLRGQRFNIYTHIERILLNMEQTQKNYNR